MLIGFVIATSLRDRQTDRQTDRQIEQPLVGEESPCGELTSADKTTLAKKLLNSAVN